MILPGQIKTGLVPPLQEELKLATGKREVETFQVVQ